MSFVYLGFLLFSLAGMVLLDVREKLFFAQDPRRAALVLLAGLVFFLAWDVAGISLGIFVHSQSAWATSPRVGTTTSPACSAAGRSQGWWR